MAKLFSTAAAVLLCAAFCMADMSGQEADDRAIVTGRSDRSLSGPDRTGMRGLFDMARDMYDRGMYDKAGRMFSTVADGTGNIEAEGYSILCMVKMKVPGCRYYAEAFLEKHPATAVGGLIRIAYAKNLFDAGDYAGASSWLEPVSWRSVGKAMRPEFLFMRGYCDYETGNHDRARLRFSELKKLPESDYTAPACYMTGYICYLDGEFSEALPEFARSVKDGRFSAMSAYYIAECHFMMKDYGYLAEEGPGLLESVPAEHRPRLNRMISESFLVLGNAGKARQYYEVNAETSAPSTRADYFYAGSVLYAVEDFRGAIDNFSRMGDLQDSIGQVAAYKLAYSHIRTRNKVAALDAFRSAASMDFNPDISEDAFFNFAKLSFDLNNDGSVFRSYLEKYPDTGKKEMIYSYIAVAALQDHDYAGAIEAYDNIDELDGDMRLNYMKANYLRASELVSSGSYRAAVPCLKAAAYYSDRRGMFNQMSRYWLAESYYRDDRFSEALSSYMGLYNISALYGLKESWLIPYDIAYCHFKLEDYVAASDWFMRYLTGGDTSGYRKDAMLRYADCLFMQKEYPEAAEAYRDVLTDYFDVNDIYPYYQAAISSGLAGDMARKTALLKHAEKAEPSSPFYAEALFELGRSYVVTGNEAQAVVCYKNVIRNVKDSTFVARSLIELGMIARNMSRYEEAVGYYSTVVEQMPYSGYADDALLAIESIYRSLNEPQKYLDYIGRIGKASIKTEDEREMMIFSAAEQIFLTENYQKALLSLQSYIDGWPQGTEVQKAYFYMGECYRNLGKPDQACDCYAEAASSGEGDIAEIACLNFASLSFSLQRYEAAYQAYVSLADMAAVDNNIHVSKVGMMRSAYRAKMYPEAAEAAVEVKDDSRSDRDMVREAEYVLAKSYLAMSRRDEAYDIFRKLSEWPATPEGAEAVYLLILDSYDRGDFEDVETRVYSFSDLSSGQDYWLAKAFIVLGDSFVERGEYEQAMATFRSVADGYIPASQDDDVQDNVGMRINRLEEIMQQAPAGDN